jgi:hypothetical protein
MDKEGIFPPSGLYRLKQFYHSRFLFFKTITSAVQADIAQGPNTRDGESTST